MNKKIEFLKKLAALFEDYGVTVDEVDDYDGEENWTGTYYSIEGDGFSIPLGKLRNEIWEAQHETP